MDSFKKLGVSVYYESVDYTQKEKPALVVLPCTDEEWNALLTRGPHTLDWIASSRALPQEDSLAVGQVPVLLWGEESGGDRRPFAEQYADQVIVFYSDIIAATFFMLTRWEETVKPTRDQHGRFPATSSVAYKQGFLDRPIVDQYALILREWLKVLLPGWRPKQGTFSVKLSHDIDSVYPFQSVYAAVRTLGGDLLKRRSLERASSTVRNALQQAVSPDQTEDIRGIYRLAELSNEHGLDHNEAFYFMTDGPGPLGYGYDPASPIVRESIKHLREQGLEIGLHASYHAFQNPVQLAEEKARLDTILGETCYGGRQHYLRFQVPDTWRHWERLGMTYDSTMAYANHEGFRCGTCHPFRPFDIEQNREMDIREVPLIVMDGTLRSYRGLTPEEGEARILELAQRCKQVEGVFTLLWHNSSLYGEWRPWAQMYQRVLKSLSTKGA